MGLSADLATLVQKLTSFQDKETTPSTQPKSPAPLKPSNPLLSPVTPVRPPVQSSSTKPSTQPSAVKPSSQLSAEPNDNNPGVCWSLVGKTSTLIGHLNNQPPCILMVCAAFIFISLCSSVRFAHCFSQNSFHATYPCRVADSVTCFHSLNSAQY